MQNEAGAIFIRAGDELASILDGDVNPTHAIEVDQAVLGRMQISRGDV
jgi:hypothetical protein